MNICVRLSVALVTVGLWTIQGPSLLGFLSLDTTSHGPGFVSFWLQGLLLGPT